MGKAGKWIKSLLVGGKKEKHNSGNHPSNAVAGNLATTVVISPATSKEKKRWSFRRSSATAPSPKDSNTNATAPGPKDSNTNETTPAKATPPASSESPQGEQKKSDLAAVAADIAAEQDAVEIQQMEADEEEAGFIEEAAATKIQSVFRSYLARKALRALRGLVKLQALVRGHLVRKQAKATLRCMQALVTAQARARAQRIRAADEGMLYDNHRHSTQRINGHDYNFRNSYPEVEKGAMEEDIKIVEMDLGESNGTSRATRSSYSNYHNNGRMDGRFSDPYAQQFDYANQDYHKISPAPSAITDISPRTCSGHFEDYSFNTAQSSPQCYYTAVSKPDPSRTPFAFPHQEYAESLSYEYPAYPSYMANTQSSRAKARSQSAPKQRPESFERQLSRRRPSVEGRNIPRAVRMQRSTSHVGSAAQNYQYPWSVKLDKSMVSLKDSECGSTCSVFTNANYCRSVVSYDPQGVRY